MFPHSLARAMAIVFALAALAFTASGVPENKGTYAAIGWWSFVALVLVFLVQAGTALRRWRRAKRYHEDRAHRMPVAHQPNATTHRREAGE